MATANGKNEKELVAAWAKAQAQVNTAQKALDAARVEVNRYTKAIFEARGTSPFYVKSLDRGYRAMYKPARQSTKGNAIAEQYNVVPLPDFTPQDNF